MKAKYLLAGIISALLLFTGCDSSSEIDENLVANVKNNKPVEKQFVAKTFKLTTTDGKIFEATTTKDKGLIFKDFVGKKAVLVDVFATWCPPCIKSIPTMNELRAKYGNDFEIVSVLFEAPEDKPKEEILEFIAKYGITYPITYGLENFELAKGLGNVQKIPELFLYDKNGVFIKKFVGENEKETFEKYIKMAIGQK